MKILRVHNHYRLRGGEDAVFKNEVALLKDFGHCVSTLETSNAELESSTVIHRLKAASNAIWSKSGIALLEKAIENCNPDVVHFDNTFMRLSPAVYGPAQRINIPVVQTLHNFRMVCPNALCFRQGQPCEDCVGKKIALSGIRHSCYRESRTQTAVVAVMNSVHSALGTWNPDTTTFIALSEFSKSIFVRGGLDPSQIEVKSNFAPHPDENLLLDSDERSGFVFTGRLSQEKGVDVLAEAWQTQNANVGLTIFGEGPMSDTVQTLSRKFEEVSAVGWCPLDQLLSKVASSIAAIVPSICYENFPMSIAEAFSVGTPVIASRRGSMAEIVDEGRTGLLFNPGDGAALAKTVRWALEHPAQMRVMGANARKEYVERFTPEQNYRRLIGIYDKAIGRTVGFRKWSGA